MIERLAYLRATPAVVRFLALEPLLEPIWTAPEDFEKLDWVVMGGQLGPNAQPLHPDWVRDIPDDCASMGVPFHFHSAGSWGWAADEGASTWVGSDGKIYMDRGYHRQAISFGRRRLHGLLLDGVEHDAMPKGCDA